jgi:O-antigen/teichoic acid export membrane protein
MSRTKSTIFLSIGKVLASISALLIASLLAHKLSYKDFASYKQLLLTYKISSPVLILGLNQILMFYIPRDIKNGRKYLGINLASLFLMALIAITFIFIFNSYIASYFNNDDLSYLLYFFAFYFLFNLPIGSFDAVFVSYQKTKQLAIFSIISKTSIFLILIVLYLLNSFTIDKIVLTIVVVSFINFTIGFIWAYRISSGNIMSFSLKDIKNQILFSIPLGINNMIAIWVYNMDKLIVGRTTDAKNFAIYSNGAMEIPLLGIITGAVTMVLMSDFSRWYKEKNYADIIKTWNNSIKKTALIIFPIFFFMLLNSENIMLLLYGEKFKESAVIFNIFLLILPLRIANYGSIFIAAGKQKLILYRTLTEMVLILALAFVFNEMFGFKGVAIAVVLVTLTFNIFYNLYTISKILQTSIKQLMPFKYLLKIAILCLFALLPMLFSFQLNIIPLHKLIVNAVIYCSILLLLFHFSKTFTFIDLKKLYAKK